MKESTVNNYDELPLFLNARQIASILGIGVSTIYEKMKENDFPSIRIGTRYVVSKEHFKAWIDKQMH